jgi:uncharacterized coiled-coil protein SlyX
MQSGNGIDLAAIHQLLTEVAQRVGAIETRLDSHAQKLNELAVVVNDHTRKLDQLAAVVNGHTQKIDDVAAGLRELRLTVYQYHEAVVGHGMSLTRLDERIQRIEEHLHLDPATG